LGQIIHEFISDIFWDIVFDDDSLQKLNITSVFAKYLVDEKEFPRLKSEEEAEKNKVNLLTQLQSAIDEWEKLGIPKLIFLRSDTALTWRHPKFSKLSGFENPPKSFGETYKWIRSCHEKEFLLPCAFYLYSIGCNKIFITDKSGDGGVDVIGVGDKSSLKGVI